MAPNPRPIGSILSELMARRGYARVQSGRAYEAAWRQAAGELTARYTRVGALRRGTLEVIVVNSTLVQELTFQKLALLRRLTKLLPDERLQDLRFHVGSLDP